MASNNIDMSTTGKKGEGKNHNTRRFMGRLKISPTYMVAFDSQEGNIVSYMSKQAVIVIDE
jgi:hypothetical protein